MEAWVQEDLQPDLTLRFDLPVEVGLARAGRRSAADRFEQEEYAFFERVRAAYLQRAAAAPERYAVIDSNRERAAVSLSIEQALDTLFA